MMLRTRLILAVSLTALCLGATSAMADFVDFYANDTVMTITSAGATGAVATITPEDTTSTLEVNVKADDNSLLDSMSMGGYDLTAVLTFVGMGNDYSATGTLAVNDAEGTKILADFQSTDVSFAPLIPDHPYSNYITVHGTLSPQSPNKSILLGGGSYTWDFVDTPTETASLAGNIASFDAGNMVVFKYNIPFGSLQDFLSAQNAEGDGMLVGTVTPVPVAVLLGVIGMGVAGLKLRKFA